jgi:peptidyl-prolyl cis-trans isomerase B (cyclophilin B)
LRYRPIVTVAVVSMILASANCGSDDNPCSLPPQTNNPVVVFETTLGEFAAVLYPREVPKTVDNFLRYANESFYDSLIFHRVIKGFIIQGGGYDDSLQRKPAHEPIQNEAEKARSNTRGTLGMARSADPHSATCQFFINHEDNPSLDFREAPGAWGYCVFGEVIVGMDVVDRIANVETTTRDGFNDVPVEPVVILKLYLSN